MTSLAQESIASVTTLSPRDGTGTSTARRPGSRPSRSLGGRAHLREVRGPDDLAALFAEYRRTGDRGMRNELVEAHRHVADYFVKRYSRRGVAADDLGQVALLAIVRAVDRYDPAQGVAFSTFASRTIDGELKRHFRDKTWAVRPPRTAQELHLALRHAEEALVQRLRRSPTVAELAAEVGESVDHVLEAMEAGGAHQSTSLDQTASGPDDAEGSALAERVLGREDRGYSHVERQQIVQELLDSLDERDRAIIEMRFFENRTQEEIAAKIGVSQSYLSRLLRRALLALRDQLADPDPELV
jgi:RNA polymerase sigma-B factor